MAALLRSALVVCAAFCTSAVAPALAGPPTHLVIQAATTVSTPQIAQDLLRTSDQLAIPPEEQQSQSNQPEAQVDADADLPTMVAQLRSSDPGSRELECLAAGVYFESKGEPLSGQLAVADVIANRAGSGRFPDSYCAVLLQKGQFSFVRHGSWPRISRNAGAWKTAVAVAKIADQDLMESTAADALYFHARTARPGWHKKQVAAIGNHLFFR